MTKVSLVTTVYNEASGIAAFIESINRQTVPPDEIVIVDGGSTDGTAEKIRALLNPNVPSKVIVDHSCNKAHTPGPIARGRNIGVRAASYEYIVVTDAGCELDAAWVQSMKRSFAEGAYDVVAGWYQPKSGNRFQRYIGDIFCPPLSEVDPAKFRPSSRSIGFTKHIWAQVGGYPEDSYAAEDTVFNQRLYNTTDRVTFNPEAVVYWDTPQDFQELKKKLMQYAAGDAHHRIFPGRYAARAVFLLLAPLTVPYLVVRRKKIIILTFYYYQVLGYISGLFASRRQTLQKSDAAGG